MHARSFTHRQLTIRVECAKPAALHWLDEFLTPCFAASDDARPDWTVALVADAAAHAAALARGARADGGRAGCFAFDDGLVSLPWWTSVDDARVVFDDAANVFYELAHAGARTRVLVDDERPPRRISLMRVVRELAVSHAWSPTSAVVHGAALAVGEQGIVISGEKGAGKTTLLMQLLLSGAAGALVANDRFVLDVGGAALVAGGMPTVVQVRPAPADRLPTLHRWFARPPYDHRLALNEPAASLPASAGRAPLPLPVQLSPAQFSAWLGVPRRGACRPAALLFPRVVADLDGIEVEALAPPAAATRLRRSLWGGSRTAISEVFALPARGESLDAGGLDRLCATAVARLRCFECRLGRGADHPAAARQLLERVLASAP